MAWVEEVDKRRRAMIDISGRLKGRRRMVLMRLNKTFGVL